VLNSAIRAWFSPFHVWRERDVLHVARNRSRCTASDALGDPGTAYAVYQPALLSDASKSGYALR